jgi:hypothetical protein
MDISRRGLLRLSGLIAAGIALSGCGPLYKELAGLQSAPEGWLPSEPKKPATPTFQRLSRLTFGPSLEERQHVANIGLEAWIEEQLAPDLLDDTVASLLLRPLDTLWLDANELVDLSDKLFEDQDRQTVPAQLRQATLLRQVYSRRQLNEVMVEFWTDHFNVSVDKSDCWYLKTVDDREVIRPHALGRFRDLLRASAHSPAMLVYLDNQSNHKGAPNENYARELMELHTLGVDGGYSQRDVMELARCLTGWTVKEHFWRGDFVFEDGLHDHEPKTVLGMVLDSGGQGEAEQVLDLLASHPSTARFVSAKLARRFVADDPPRALVEHATNTFVDTDGDIRAVLRTLLLDGLDEMAPKYKRPANFVVSALRQLNAETDGGQALHDYLARMGQPYFGWPTPDGFPDYAEAWSGNLMPRWQFAMELVQNEIPDTEVDLSRLAGAAGADTPHGMVQAFGNLLLGQPPADAVCDDLLSALEAAGAQEAHLPAVIVAGLLASPAFQWR